MCPWEDQRLVKDFECVSVADDIEYPKANYSRFQDILGEVLAGGTRLGVVGLRDMPGPILHGIREAVAGLEIEDAASILNEQRVIKIVSTQPRPEGKRVATWQIERMGKALLFSGEVFDSDNQPDNFWPWGRDNVHLWLDFRPTARFADIGIDSDVHMTILTFRDKPRWACTMIPWLGRGMQFAAESGAERTATGWTWSLYVHNYFTKPRPADFSKADFVGFNMIVCDQDKVGKRMSTSFFTAWEASEVPDKFANAYMIVDLKNRFRGDAITNVHLFGR